MDLTRSLSYEEDDLNGGDASCPLKQFRFSKKKIRKRVGSQIRGAPATRHSPSFIPSRPRGFIRTSPTLDENLDPSIAHLHHDPLSTSHRNKEGVRPYHEKPSQRLTSVGRMVRQSKKYAPKERWWGSSRVGGK